MRLDDIKPASLPTLAEVRAPLAEQWTLRENAKRLTDAGADVLVMGTSFYKAEDPKELVSFVRGL